MKKLSDKIRPDGHEGDAPRHGAFRHPEVSNRLSGMVTRALRLLPSVTVVLVLVTWFCTPRSARAGRPGSHA